MQLFRRRKSWGYDRFHSCGAWPSKLQHDLTPSVTRLGSGLKGCMLSNTWNCHICKFRAPGTVGIYCMSQNRWLQFQIWFWFLFVYALFSDVSVIRAMLCRVVGLLLNNELAKKPLWPSPSCSHGIFLEWLRENAEILAEHSVSRRIFQPAPPK
jgi:hypothetical protein